MTDARMLSSNSLLPIGLFVMAALNPAARQVATPSILSVSETGADRPTRVFERLPGQNITIEQGQMEVLTSFLTKLAHESKDLDGQIVDMVNRKFEKLLLKI